MLKFATTALVAGSMLASLAFVPAVADAQQTKVAAASEGPWQYKYCIGFMSGAGYIGEAIKVTWYGDHSFRVQREFGSNPYKTASAGKEPIFRGPGAVHKENLNVSSDGSFSIGVSFYQQSLRIKFTPTATGYALDGKEVNGNLEVAGSARCS